MTAAEELFPILLEIHGKAAQEMAPDGGHLHCNECDTNGVDIGTAKIADYLRDGWPNCCEQQMRLVVHEVEVANDDEPGRDYDVELALLEQCLKALAALDDHAARRRVLEYLNRKFGGDD